MPRSFRARHEKCCEIGSSTVYLLPSPVRLTPFERQTIRETARRHFWADCAAYTFPPELVGCMLKIQYDDLSSKQVFSLAISTFKSNHEQIKAQFLAH